MVHVTYNLGNPVKLVGRFRKGKKAARKESNGFRLTKKERTRAERYWKFIYAKEVIDWMDTILNEEQDDELDQAWCCPCGHYEESGLHCSVCGNEPPWGCDCSFCNEPADEFDVDHDFDILTDD